MLSKTWRIAWLPALFACPIAQAVVAVTVPDASQLTYMTDPSGRVYLRNLDTFAPGQALGCCYNYYIDTTATEGKLLFSIMLTDIARNARFQFFIPDSLAPGPISFGGNL